MDEQQGAERAEETNQNQARPCPRKKDEGEKNKNDSERLKEHTKTKQNGGNEALRGPGRVVMDQSRRSPN